MSKHQFVILSTTSLLSLAIGATAGYFFAKDRLGREFDERLTKEVASAKKFYSRLHKRDGYDLPNNITEDMLPIEKDAMQAMHVYQGIHSVESVEDEEIVYERSTTHTGEPLEEKPTIVRNIFEAAKRELVNNEPSLDELQARTEDAPYIITNDEYMTNELDFSQSALTYFQEDNILVDERDDVVPDVDATVGDDNLVKFGQWSEDPKVVFVRNHHLQAEYEIIRHEGSYAVVVMGLESTKAGG